MIKNLKLMAECIVAKFKEDVLLHQYKSSALPYGVSMDVMGTVGVTDTNYLSPTEWEELVKQTNELLVRDNIVYVAHDTAPFLYGWPKVFRFCRDLAN